MNHYRSSSVSLALRIFSFVTVKHFESLVQKRKSLDHLISELAYCHQRLIKCHISKTVFDMWRCILTFFYCSRAFTQGLINLPFISESALDRLFEDYLHGPSKPDRGSPSIVKANEEPNVYADEPEVSIDFRHDGMESGNSVVAKRYYYGRRCNISRLSRKAFVELIKTGKLCGRRVAAIRFGLTGR